MKGTSTIVWLAIILGFLFLAGYLKIGGVTETGISPGAVVPSVGPGYATTISVSLANAITGASITDANCYVYANDNSWSVRDVQINAATTSVSTAAPNSLDGWALCGNDANQGTDRGTEWYFHKVPENYVNQGAVRIRDKDGSDTVKLYAETASLTSTCYDDGTAESTCNVTVGTSIVSSTELKVETAANSCFGNPDFSRPVGVCFNVTTMSNWDEVRPTNYAGTFSIPEAFKGKNMVGCYVLPTTALCDDGGAHDTFYRFYVTMDPAANPGITDSINAHWMDRTYSLDDSLAWRDGFADDSAKGTDYDPGFATNGDQTIYMT